MEAQGQVKYIYREFEAGTSQHKAAVATKYTNITRQSMRIENVSALQSTSLFPRGSLRKEKKAQLFTAVNADETVFYV